MAYTKIANVGEIPESGVLAVKIGLTKIVVIREPSGEIFALEDRCSHANVRLSKGKCSGGELECPAHGAKFDVRTGKNLCLPAVAPVKTYKVQVSGEEILVEI